ncbi:programmed cell death 1 ligand 1-like [Protopterus annectens]|uniref:programmed cell death 1 ligand 1-like n=1 Tax=Protopterus annectens TaxID=7888 RepID=UPI001CFAA0F9|nr:programmed cell death 1 ligand 1-like [Protopterus annectens]
MPAGEAFTLQLTEMALQILLFMVCLKGTGAALKVFMPISPVTAHAGSNVLLECYFSDTTQTVDLSKLVLTWRFQNREVAKYDEDTDEIVTNIPRAELFVNELQNGNASLLLKNITSKDAGIYTCSVNYYPEIEIKELTLNVSDPPPTAYIPTDFVDPDYDDGSNSSSNTVAGVLLLQTIFVVMYLL